VASADAEVEPVERGDAVTAGAGAGPAAVRRRASPASRGPAHRVDAVALVPDVAGWVLRDRPRPLDIVVTAPPGDLWVVPIEVVAASEAGYERTFQGTTLWSVRPLVLTPGTQWEGTFRVAVRRRG
jgi:hypothetical protein